MSTLKRGTLNAALAAPVPLGVVVANETTSTDTGAVPLPAAASVILDNPATPAPAPGVDELIAGLTVTRGDITSARSACDSDR
ncbi:hypothetical protein AB4Z09_18225 [Rhodococcus sp. TAF43]|uniref:hypothetical protein n=1 Tax=Rhodococcus sp. TAF43 TaxID=3237483 RepID=UPI003F9A6E25